MVGALTSAISLLEVIVSAAIDAYLDYIEGDVLNGCRCMRNARG